MRLNRSILFAATITAATSGTVWAQTEMENPPPPPPGPQVVPAPVVVPAPPPPPVMQPVPGTPPAYYGQPVPVTPPVYYGRSPDVMPPPHATWMPSSGIGLGLFVGGGVTDYFNGATRSVTNTGGSWTGRITFGTRSIVGFEGSYVGAANPIAGLGGGATLIRSGLEASLRLNVPIYAQNTLFEPYIMGGLGWNAYHISDYNSAALASLNSGTDNTLSIPAALGFTVGYRGFLADLRYTYRPTYNQDIIVNATNTALTNWDLGGMIGYEF